MTSSLGKLQDTVIKQEQKIIHLQDKLAEIIQDRDLYKSKLNRLQIKYDYSENNINKIVEEKIAQSVEKSVTLVTEKFEKIIKEKDQRIFELENRLNINSDNSSLPSSKTPIYQSKICNSRKPTNRKIGGQLGHKKSTLEKFKDEEVTEYVEHKESKCKECNSTNIKELGIKTRDEYDIKINIIKRRHNFYEYQCLDCGATFASEIPLELHSENQYGSGIKALALTLNNYGFVSYNRTRKILCGLTNGEIDPSEGYLVKLQKKVSDKLSNFVFDVKEKILKSKLVYWDDTCIKIGEKDKACLRVYTNEQYVLYKAHMAKNAAGMDEDGILQNLPSDCTVMHDHLLHNYCDDYKYKNIECNAHITRKLEGITQNANHKWSNDMKELLESTLEKRNKLLEQNKDLPDNEKVYSFDEVTIDNFYVKYDQIIENGFKEYIEFKHQYEFEKEENLLEFMRDFKEPITNWIKDFNLPYSNNLCESLLRMLKSKMKISYQFKDLKYASYFANIMSYTETCGRIGINRYEAIKRLFEVNPYTIEELDKVIAEKKTTNS